MKEFRLISALGSPSAKGLLKGIGDDCAVIAPSEGKDLLITTDAMMQDVHFSFSYMTPRQTGRKAAAVNVSDICAMGGVPKFAFVTIGLPSKNTEKYFNQIMKGISFELERYGAVVAGGDTIRSEKVLISITLTGECAHGRHVTRDSAKPGDIIFVTGALGGSGCGLRMLREGKKGSCVKKHIAPQPKFVEGAFLASLRVASSMIDVSDGLVSDITRICEASGTGAMIDTEKVPVFAGALLSDALYGGEDYELIFTVAPKNKDSLLQAASKYGMEFYEIGIMTKGRNVRLKTGGKIKTENYKKAWKHF